MTDEELATLIMVTLEGLKASEYPNLAYDIVEIMQVGADLEVKMYGGQIFSVVVRGTNGT
ncbi:MAG: hypothetical protein C4534_02120 [Gaiellales bacterium]|nr:MAG: hypothetical protein C4534_02120 [Gaiellales bacterium]